MRFTIRSRLSTSLASFVIFIQFLVGVPQSHPLSARAKRRPPAGCRHQGVLPPTLPPKLSNRAWLAHSPHLNPLLIQLTRENTLHIHAGRVNLVPIQLAR